MARHLFLSAFLLLGACSGAATITGSSTTPPTPPTSAEPAASEHAALSPWELSEADEAFLDDWSATFGFRLGAPRAVEFVPGEDRVIYLRSEARSPVQSLYELDLDSGVERTLLTAEHVLNGADQEFSQEELDRRERLRERVGGITSYELTEDGRALLVPLGGSLFMVDRISGVSREVAPDTAYNNSPVLSPTGSHVAMVRDDELWVVAVSDGEANRQLTDSAETGVTNGLADFIAQEEMGRYAGFWWSTDGTHIAYQETDDSGVERLSRLDSLDPANEGWHRQS
jgi:dipeptidyl-peptidase-4